MTLRVRDTVAAAVLVAICAAWPVRAGLVGSSSERVRADDPVEPAHAGIPADPEPRWWRGNLHTHTFWSDGDHFPEMAIDWYVRHGYHFLALSDHNVLSQGERWISEQTVVRRSRGDALPSYIERFGEHWVQTRPNDRLGMLEIRLKPFEEYRHLFEVRGQFMLMPAEEVTGSASNGRAIHMNATNLVEVIDPPEAPTVPDYIRETIARARDQAERYGRDILVHVNHPNYKWGVTAEDLAAIVEERFFEVFNGVAGDNDPGDDVHPSTDEIWDIANTLRIAGMDAPPLFALATDDTHDYHSMDERASAGRGWIMVRARHLTPGSIIAAMRKGEFYASTGVTIDSVRFDGSTLTLSIHPVPGERYTTRFIGTRQGVSIDGSPRTDDQGRVVDTTLDYTTDAGPQIGEVLKEVRGTTASYTLRGDELYVRALVVSDAQPEQPTPESTHKMAWTQPVGWRARLGRSGDDAR